MRHTVGSTADLDTAMMRYLVSWDASSPNFTLASLDVTTAFLNTPSGFTCRPSCHLEASLATLQVATDAARSCLVGVQTHVRFT